MHCSEELRSQYEKMESYKLYYTFQTELTDFWASFLPFGIKRWCEVYFTVLWGFSKCVWKEWISITLLHFSDWINRFLSFLLAFWNYQMMWSPLHSAVRTFEGCLKRMDLKYTITLFRLNLQISEFLSCLLELPDECEVRFAFQKGNSKVVWKEWGLKYCCVWDPSTKLGLGNL